MIKEIVIGVSFSLLAGCASTRVEYQKVEVPVWTPPSITIPQKPYLPIQDIKPTDSDGQVAKAYVISLEELQLYSDSLHNLLEAILSQQSKNH